MLFNHFRMAENPTQDIVEVMGDAAGERTYRFHPLGLLQAGLQPCTFFFHGVPFDSIDDGIESHAQQTKFAAAATPTTPPHLTQPSPTATTLLTPIRHP